MVKRPGHSPNKHKTNWRPHRRKWTEVCSTSHTRTKRPTSGSGRGQPFIISNVRKLMWYWIGHINRLKDDRRTSHVTTWGPRKKRRHGKPAKRRRDDLDKYWIDRIWQRTAQYRLNWRRHAETFDKPRDTTLPSDEDDQQYYQRSASTGCMHSLDVVWLRELRYLRDSCPRDSSLMIASVLTSAPRRRPNPRTRDG